jgi:hypothetical protein
MAKLCIKFIKWQTAIYCQNHTISRHFVTVKYLDYDSHKISYTIFTSGDLFYTLFCRPQNPALPPVTAGLVDLVKFWLVARKVTKFGKRDVVYTCRFLPGLFRLRLGSD